MRSIALCAASLVLMALPAYGEPLPVKNHSPVWFGLLFPTGDTPRATPEGEAKYRLDADYSNIFFIPANKQWDLQFDMELAQATVDARRGLPHGFEAGIEQPFFHMGGGFMDQTVADHHTISGLPRYDGQEEAPQYRFSYRMEHNGVAWHAAAAYRGTAGDTTFWLKKEFFSDEGTLASLKVLVQAPTASTTEGMGNGAWEGGAVVMAERRFDQMLAVDASAGWFEPNFIGRGETYTLKGFFYWDVALEYGVARWAAVAQFTGATSPYAGEGPDLLQRQWEGLTIGLRHLMDSGKKLEVSVTEDLSFSAPDFTLHIGVKF